MVGQESSVEERRGNGALVGSSPLKTKRRLGRWEVSWGSNGCTPVVLDLTKSY
jgi:hypothetical protein